MNKFSVFSLIAIAAAFAAACQAPSNPHTNTAGNTAANMADHSSHTNSNAANMPGHDMSNMAGHDMSKMDHGAASAPGAASQPYDLQFLDSMIHHHEGALQMSKMVLGKTKRQEMKTFAQKIVDDQTKEIAQMKGWREQWFSGKPSALNMALPGMEGGTKMMNSEHVKEMDDMDADHFDSHFLTMMIQHHEGAVLMAKDALNRGEHAEVKQIAQEIIREQEAEIKQMQAWKTKWKE